MPSTNITYIPLNGAMICCQICDKCDSSYVKINTPICDYIPIMDLETGSIFLENFNNFNDYKVLAEKVYGNVVIRKILNIETNKTYFGAYFIRKIMGNSKCLCCEFKHFMNFTKIFLK